MKATLVKTILISLSLLWGTSLFASVNDYSLEPMPIVEIQIGDGNKNIEAVTEYSNGCFEPWFSLKGVKDGKLILVHLAQYFTDTVCTRAFEFKKLKFNIVNLSNGQYQIVDGADGELLGILKKTDKSVRIINN